MKHLLERLGLGAIARRLWPRVLRDFQLDEPGGEADPLVGTRRPHGGGPLRGRSTGVALEEPLDGGLADAVALHRRR